MAGRRSGRRSGRLRELGRRLLAAVRSLWPWRHRPPPDPLAHSILDEHGLAELRSRGVLVRPMTSADLESWDVPPPRPSAWDRRRQRARW